MNRSALFISIALLIVVLLGIYLRTGLLKFQGLFEPDGFFHYSIIMQSIANGYSVPLKDVLSGFPVHNTITEPLGLYYMTIIPYAMLGGSVSALTIMRNIPLLFGILDILGAFLLVMYLAKSRWLGLIAALFVAVSNGDIARTGALVYRGDGFITIFMIVALILLVRAFNERRFRRTLIYGSLSALVMGIGTAVWGGAPFMIFVYILAVALISIYGFVIADERVIMNGSALTALLLITYIIQHIWMYVGVIRGGEALSSTHFFLFYAPLLLGTLVAYYLVKSRGRLPYLTMNAYRRAEVCAAFVIIVFVLLELFAGRYLHTIASGDGLVIAGNTLTQSIQELQHPTLAFIWGSFGFELPLAIIGVILFLALAYMSRYRSDIVDGVDTRMSPAFLALLSYLAITGYLQLNAIRFNSLFALPVAILGAYAVYIIGKILFKRFGVPDARPTLYISAIMALYLLVSTYYILTGRLPFGIYVNMLIAVIISAVLSFVAAHRGASNIFPYIFIMIVVIIIFYSVLLSYLGRISSAPADGIDPQFLAAMTWLKSNTPANATTLAVWPDGSVIEGWAHRQSSTDSVNGQNAALIKGFANFVLNSSTDMNYLNLTGRPEYLVARYYWLSELPGIVEEAGINAAAAGNGYGIDQFTNVSIKNGNAPNSLVYFFSGQIDGEMLVNVSGNRTYVNSYLVNGTRGIPLSGTILYNINTGTSENFSSLYNRTSNATMLVLYSNGGGTNSSVVGAYVLGNAIRSSNAAKFLFLCSATSCDYGSNSTASMSLVYSNSDTRIFKINYH